MEALEVTVDLPVFLSSVALHALIPNDAPIIVYARLEDAQSLDTHHFEDILEETTVVAGAHRRRATWQVAQYTCDALCT